MVGWLYCDKPVGTPKAHLSFRFGTCAGGQSRILSRLEPSVAHIRAPSVPRGSRRRIGHRRIRRAMIRHVLRPAFGQAAERACRHERREHAALIFAQRVALSLHRAGGQRCVDAFRRHLADLLGRLCRGNSRVAVAAHAASLERGPSGFGSCRSRLACPCLLWLGIAAPVRERHRSRRNKPRRRRSAELQRGECVSCFEVLI